MSCWGFSSEEQGSNCAGTGADKEWRHGSLKKNSQQEYGGIYIYIFHSLQNFFITKLLFHF